MCASRHSFEALGNHCSPQRCFPRRALLFIQVRYASSCKRAGGRAMINPLIYFLLFLKASLFSTGGFSNLPSLHQDLTGNGWAKESVFGQSIAIGQISPGPNGLWVISLGYLTYGYLGAFLALIAITIPALLVLVISAGYTRIEHKTWVQGAMYGVSLAVVGLLLTVVWTILRHPGIDWKGLLIAVGAFGLASSHKVHILIILGLAGLAGYLLYR